MAKKQPKQAPVLPAQKPTKSSEYIEAVKVLRKYATGFTKSDGFDLAKIRPKFIKDKEGKIVGELPPNQDFTPAQKRLITRYWKPTRIAVTQGYMVRRYRRKDHLKQAQEYSSINHGPRFKVAFDNLKAGTRLIFKKPKKKVKKKAPAFIPDEIDFEPEFIMPEIAGEQINEFGLRQVRYKFDIAELFKDPTSYLKKILPPTMTKTALAIMLGGEYGPFGQSGDINGFINVVNENIIMYSDSNLWLNGFEVIYGRSYRESQKSMGGKRVELENTREEISRKRRNANQRRYRAKKRLEELELENKKLK